MHRLTILCLAFVAMVECAESTMAENWPQWRGPLGTGVAADGEYPVTFSDTENVAWKVKLPGRGSSTPALWGDRIFVSCAIGKSPEALGFRPGKMEKSNAKDGLLCYDMKGTELWRKEIGAERAGQHANGSGSNPSPATDGKHVVAYYKSGALACFDVAGKELWKTNLQDRFSKDTLWWDLGTSPILVDDCVVVAVQQSPHGRADKYAPSAGGDERVDGHSYLVAFKLDGGDVKWNTPREYACAEESDQSYSTPQVVEIDGKKVIVTWGADHLTGHDAGTGKLLWESGDFNPNNQRAWRTIASVVVSDGVAVVPYGRGEFLAGVRVGGSGDITKSNRLWDIPKIAGDVPTPIIRDHKVYVINDKGGITCLALESGHELWKAELKRNRGKYYSSPVLAGNKLYNTREDGVIFVGEVSDTGYKDLAENNMGERIIATPVPIRGGLLIRGDEDLYMIGANPIAGK
jgi:outer membrane protein assembly factor BamB